MDHKPTQHQKALWPQTGQFLNYNLNERGGLLNDELPRSQNKYFKVTLAIYNETDFPLTNLMLVHSNLQNYTYLPRALYQQMFALERIVENKWPVFKSPSSASHHDGFQIQFCAKINGKTEQHINQQIFEVTLRQYIDDKITITIKQVQIEEDSWKFAVELYFPSLNGLKQPLWKKQEHKICVHDPPQTKSDKQLKGKPLIKMLDEKNEFYSQKMETMIGRKNKEAIEILEQMYADREDSLFFNEYSFLASYYLKDQRLYLTNPAFRKEHQDILECQLKELEPREPFKSLEEIKRYYSKKKGIKAYMKSSLQFLKQFVSFDKRQRKTKKQLVINQGNRLGNCYFIAVMDQIISKADFILDKIWIFEDKNNRNAVTILNIDGRMVSVNVDFNIFTENNENILKYAHFSTFENIPEERKYKSIQRAILLEKCMAKIFSGFHNLKGGFADEIFMMITNHNTTLKLFSSNLPFKSKFEVVDVMIKWSREMKSISDNLMQINSLKQDSPKDSSNSSIDPKIQRLILPEYQFIVLSDFKGQHLSKIFPRFSAYQIKQWTLHSYSFQGIEPKQEYSESRPYFVKVRDLRESPFPCYWKTYWYDKHKYTLNKEVISTIIIEHQEFQQVVKYQSKLSFPAFQIACSQNQFLVEIHELFSLHGFMEVCSYNPYYSYKSIPVIMKDGESSNFILQTVTQDVHTESKVNVNIHQKNHHRRKKKKNQLQKMSKQQVKEQHQRKLYIKTNFQLEYLKRFKLPELSHVNIFMMANCKFPLKGRKWYKNKSKDYPFRTSIPIKVHMEETKQQYELCYLSVLVQQKKEVIEQSPERKPTTKIFLQQDFDSLDKSPIIYHKIKDSRMTDQMSYHNKDHEKNYTFIQKLDRQQEAIIQCKFRVSMLMEQRQIGKSLMITSHCISQNFLEHYSQNPEMQLVFIDDFEFQPAEDEPLKAGDCFVIKGKFKSKSMQYINNRGDYQEGRHTLRIGLSNNIKMRLKQQKNSVFEVSYHIYLEDAVPPPYYDSDTVVTDSNEEKSMMGHHPEQKMIHGYAETDGKVEPAEEEYPPFQFENTLPKEYEAPVEKTAEDQ